MELKNLFADDRAVSPVIGVILMVAITVILAAVIGTFVLGIGQDQQTTPQPVLDFTWDGSELTITHEGGDTINGENTGQSGACTSVPDGAGGTMSVPGLTFSADGSAVSGECWRADSGGISAGQSHTLSSRSPGETVRVVWQAPGGGNTQTLGTFEIPN